MNLLSLRSGVWVLLLAALALGAVGCESKGGARKRAKSKNAHVHGAWWCDEHGVPEEVCSMCSPKAAAEFKKKGDWCEKHERADSQCFICHPENAAKYAAEYEAKYGKKPPRAEGNEPPGAEEKPAQEAKPAEKT